MAETLHAAFPDRFAVSPKLRTLAESRQTAIYRPDVTLDPGVVAALSGGDRPSTGEQVRQRALEGRHPRPPRAQAVGGGPAGG